MLLRPADLHYFQALSDQRTSSDGATLHPSPLRKDKTVTPGMSTKPRGDGRRTGLAPLSLPPLGAAGAALQCDTDKVAVISRSAEKENNSRREFRANQGRRAAGRMRARGGRMWALGGEAETEICAGDRQACSSRDPFQDYFLHQEWNSRFGPSAVVV